MSISVRQYASERDMVAQYLLPKVKEASRVLGYGDSIDLFMEKKINGTPDLSLYKGGKGLFLIEAKFKKAGKREVDIEPRDPEVIGQAVGYAVNGGFKFYATCNARRLVLYQLVAGKKPHESEIASFEYEKSPNWAEDCLKYVLELIEVRLKEIDDTLVDTLHEAFEDLYPDFLLSLKEKLKDSKFKKRYTKWLESQGIEATDETNRSIASQTTYLQINKLLFYQVIRQIYPDRLPKLEIKEDEDVSDALTKFYEEVKRIDYQPIYESDLISEIPFTLRAKERLRTLLDTLNEFDFSTMQSDFLGRVYEKLIPPMERKRLGQFYTPPQIVDFIINLTLKGKDDIVLDPACGSGTFLVRTYHKLRELNGVPRNIEGGLGETFHKELLSRIYGIDINQFPSHLSVINLAIQNPKAKVDKINIIVNDFFNIQAGQATLFGFQSMDAEGKTLEVDVPPSFDCVLANPPYIRQELLGEDEKKIIKEMIESEYKDKVFISKPSKVPRNAIILDKQSDIYIYFYIHGIKLLKEKGRLGFISSNKWLEVGYGEPFQQFLLDHCKILYVVEFDRAIFPDAEVNTSVMILEKESNEESRQNNSVKFIRFRQKIPIDSMLKVVQETKESIEDKQVRVNVIKQANLQVGKWNAYLRATPVFQKIVTNSKVKPLGELAEVFRGAVTGFNDYFILTREKAREWGIERRYLKLCASSPRKIKGLTIDEDELDEYFFMVNELKPKLKGTNALKYIEYGEKLEVDVIRGSQRGKRRLPELETLSSRQLWYAIPQLKEAPILFQYLIDEKAKAFWNKVKAHAPNIIHYVIPKNEVHALPLLTFFNSSVCALMVELYGRSYGGGVLKIEVYELKDLPTLDVSELSEGERKMLGKQFEVLADAIDARVKIEEELENVKSKSKKDKGLFEGELEDKLYDELKKEQQAQRELDEAVYDILGLTKSERKQVEEGLRELQELRRMRRQT